MTIRITGHECQVDRLGEARTLELAAVGLARRRFRRGAVAAALTFAGLAVLVRRGHSAQALEAPSSKAVPPQTPAQTSPSPQTPSQTPAQTPAQTRARAGEPPAQTRARAGEPPAQTPAQTRAGEPPALERTVLGEGVPAGRSEFTVSADGKRSYFPVGPAYYSFDERGDFVKRMPIASTQARTLVLLANGRFISAQNHALGQVALLGPDGSQLRALVGRGASPQNLRPDKTAWTSPTALAFDAVHQLLFALDTTAAPAGTPDPDWSRIAIFDADGKYVREIAAYDGSKAAPADEHRTWYDDIEVDPLRSILYVTARASHELWAFDYAGTLRGRVPGAAGIAVFPAGDVAVCDRDGRHVRVYDLSLHLLKTLDAPGPIDLEADAAGRLYASVADPTVLFLRWPATLSAPETIRPRFQRISVGIPFDARLAGQPFSLSVSVTGRPEPASDQWHVFARPSDGSNLRWRELDATYALGVLELRPPADLLGFNDLAIRYGKGEIGRADGAHDLHLEKTVRFDRAAESGSVSVRPVGGRSGFRRGEAIAFRIESWGAPAGGSPTLTLQRDGKALFSTEIPSDKTFWELPASVTRRLMPGHYTLGATLGSLPANPYEFDLAEAEPSSPMQRILYHEFDQTLPGAPLIPLDTAEQLAFARDYVDSLADLGFTRETDRSAARLMNSKSAGAWLVDSPSEPSAHDALPLGGIWQPELYLDRATARGLRYDTQILGHCSGVRLADSWFPPLNGALQRLSQWFGKYPAFYGFNYNDELFFPNVPFADSIAADRAWIQAATDGLRGRPAPDVFRAGLSRMYGEFDRAVQEVRPDLARTATPMWQYPAVEGSYPPTIYAHMTESYAHYLSEGYAWPWYPAHSAEILRRPGLPLMAVFDAGLGIGDGESYLKNALQVLGRGVQGFGVEHELPLRDARASNALRVMNALGEAYGPIFAEAEPDNEAAVLYSYTQDVTEQRYGLGTPHWERVLALFGAGLMAGLPMSIAYEEDLATGWLLRGGKPKVKFLFLAGQTTELPSAVSAALRAFAAAGGRVVIDADSRDFPGATRFASTLHGPAEAAHDAFDGDALFPQAQPGYEAIAKALSQQFGAARAFPADTDELWVSKNRFAAGDIRYVLLASETSPYPWDAAKVWSTAGRYTQTYGPKRVQLTVPRTPVIYDVFERQVVPAHEVGASSVVPVDLTTFPGRLYALAPRALQAPVLSARVSKASVTYSVNVGMRALVPLRIVLSDGQGLSSTLFRGTNLRGEFEHTVARPVGPGPWRLEVSELLGGKSSSLSIPSAAASEPWLSPMPDVETEREPQIRQILGNAARKLHLIGATTALPAELRTSLLQALSRQGLVVTLDAAPAAPPAAGAYLVLATLDGKGPGELLQAANQAGLFGRTLGGEYPGVGRGFISAAFAPRIYGENCLVVLGGDPRGLELATRRFVALLNAGDLKPSADPPVGSAPGLAIGGAPAAGIDLPRLSERVGIRLSAIRATHGKLALAATGYLANLARVDDEGDHGRIVAVTRVGESPGATSLYLSDDGNSYGLAARTTRRFGEGFSLLSTNATPPELFASFGDAAPFQYQFSASADATTVLAPGPYGVVAWQRKAAGWKEAWAVDYWKKFDALDWPVSASASRVPTFDTVVPKAGDLALIAFGELTNNGWLSNQAVSGAEVSARALKDGALRWHFSAPITGALLLPKVYANASGSLVVLQVQHGASASYYALDAGRPVGLWGSDYAPTGLDVSDSTRRIAAAYGNGSRVLEVRTADGTVAFSRTWHSAPLAVVFAEDGESVFVSDDAGMLSKVDAHGDLVWQTQLGCSAELARDDARLYAAGWDGRLRAFDGEGRQAWKLDLTAPMASVTVAQAGGTAARLHQAERLASASAQVPQGADLLRSGQATLSVGGTVGWKSSGKVQVEASALTNGRHDDVAVPWIPPADVYWDGTTSRKVWAEVDFKQPTSVHSLTVYENPKFPESWPTESVIQVWDDAGQRWRTAKHGLFLEGPVASYALNLERVTKLRYVPWDSYFRNFYTSEIELR